MTNQLYSSAREDYLTANANWLTDNMALYLLSNNYTFDQNHTTVADIPFNARADYRTFSNRTSTDGYANGGGALFIEFEYPDPITRIVLFNLDNGSFENSRLVAYYDDVPQFPIVPDGSSLAFLPDQTFGGFFRL